MTIPADWQTIGILPLQDFDNRYPLGQRTGLAGMRMHAPDGDALTPTEQETRGSVEGSLLFKAENGKRDFIHAWFLGPAGVVQAAESKPKSGGTVTRGGVTKPRGSGGQEWRALFAEYAPDAELEPADVEPPEFAKEQKFPADWPALVSQGTKPWEQNLHLHPAFWGLVAVNDGGDPKAGTLVHELDDNGRVEISQHLQSLVTVTDLGAGAFTANGKAVALTLAKSKQDALSGHLAMVEWLGPPAGQFVQPGQPKPPGKITCIAAGDGGTPFMSGGLGDQHTVGVDADGDPIQPLHLSLDTIFKGLEGDCPLDFDPANYQENENLPGVWQKVYLRHNFRANHSVQGGPINGVGRWSWQVQTPLFEPKEKDKDPEPKGDPRPPRGDPPPPTPPEGDPPPGEIRGPVTGGGTGVLPGTFFGQPIEVDDPGDIGRTYNGETNTDPHYAAMANCLVLYGGLAIASPSPVTGQENFTGKGALSSDDITTISKAPVSGVLTGYAGAFPWDNMPTDDTFTNPRLYAPSGDVEPMTVLKPVTDSIDDIVAGTASGKASFCLPTTGKLVFTDPAEDGTLKSCVYIQADGSGDADVVTLNSGGTQTNSYKLSTGGSGGGTGSFDADVDDGNGGTVGVTYGRQVATQLLDETTDGSGSTMKTSQLAPTGSYITGVLTKVYGEPNGSGYSAPEGYSVGITSDTDKYGTVTTTAVGTETDYTNYNADPRLYVSGLGSTDGTITIYASAYQFDGTGAQILVIVFYETVEFQ